MKLRQTSVKELHPQLRDVLNILRKRRRFDAKAVLEAKLALLREYFERHDLNAAVVGVSGGIDSAVVAAMITKLVYEGHIKIFCPVTFPCNMDGVTGQKDSVLRVRDLAEALQIDIGYCQMRSVASKMQRYMEESFLQSSFEPWASGQSIAYLRTTMLYSTTSILSQEGHKPVVVGTTNRDEGAYLGYVGKAADGMVDLQPIADLHKSEVYAIAKLLNIPESIMNVEPTGDMFDGEPDVKVFGAPYDFVELFLLWKTLYTEKEGEQVFGSFFCNAAKCQFNDLARNLVRLHEFNAHKYLCGSPSVFLDVMPRYMPGGWEENRVIERKTLKPIMASPFAMPGGDRSEFVNKSEDWNIQGMNPIFYRMTNVINQKGILWLDNHVGSAGWHHADQNGNWRNPQGLVGSARCTFEDPEFAEAIWQQLYKELPPFRHFKKDAGKDTDGTMVWRPVGISPVFRVIRYGENSVLVPHYDAPFVESKNRRTLQSVIIPIHGSGLLNFHKDAQNEIPFAERDFSDETAGKAAGEPVLRVPNGPGDMIIFDHRILHSPTKGARTIIRTDVVYERS